MMDPHQHECRCSVCGGKGLATIADAASLWTGGQVVHTNPDECRRVLAKVSQVTAATTEDIDDE